MLVTFGITSPTRFRTEYKQIDQWPLKGEVHPVIIWFEYKQTMREKGRGKVEQKPSVRKESYELFLRCDPSKTNSKYLTRSLLICPIYKN